MTATLLRYEVVRLDAQLHVTREQIAVNSVEWSWVDDVADPFVLEGATVRAFLDWVSRRGGWQWDYTDPSLKSRVDGIVLHGSIDGLTPKEALEAVLPTYGLRFQLRGTRLLVGSDPGQTGV